MRTERSTLTCKRARLHIALAVGGDLDADGEALMNAHLVDCPPCMEYRHEMASSLQPLHDPDDPPVFKPHDSVWPDLAERLPSRSLFSLSQFNGWWVAVTVCVASLAIAMFWQDQTVGSRGETAISEAKGRTNIVPGLDREFPGLFVPKPVEDFPLDQPKASRPNPVIFVAPTSENAMPILPDRPAIELGPAFQYESPAH